MSTPIEFWIPGRPTPQGSMRPITIRGGKGARAIHSDRTMQSRGLMVEIIESQWNGTVPFDTALRLDYEFVIRRPLSHYGTGRNADRLRFAAPQFPISRRTGDSDKLERLPNDALQLAGVIDDDVLICEWGGQKRYAEDGEPEGTRLLVSEVDV